MSESSPYLAREKIPIFSAAVAEYSPSPRGCSLWSVHFPWNWSCGEQSSAKPLLSGTLTSVKGWTWATAAQSVAQQDAFRFSPNGHLGLSECVDGFLSDRSKMDFWLSYFSLLMVLSFEISLNGMRRFSRELSFTWRSSNTRDYRSFEK